MTKVVNVRRGWIVGVLATAAFGAFPALAAAQDTVQNNSSNQSAAGPNASGGGGGGGGNGSGGGGGNATAIGNGPQQATNQANCIAGRDCNISQSINQNAGGAGVTGVVGVRRVGVAHAAVGHRRVFFVRRVGLARTGSDAWIPAGIGALSLAGGLALFRLRRRMTA